MKLTYSKAHNKKFLRNNLFPVGKKIIGLAGPDIEEYVDFLQQKGYKDISIYENNPGIFLNQLLHMKNLPIKYRLEDILLAPYEENTFYDLDFCGHITSFKAHIKKFHSNFILTVSELMKKKWSSIPLFLKYREEELLDTIQISDNEQLIISNKKKYSCYTYFDTSWMLIIKPIN